MILGLVFLAGGVIFFLESRNINVMGLGLFGPSLFPMLISAGLALLSLVLVLKCSLYIFKEKKLYTVVRSTFHLDKESSRSIIYAIILIIAVIVYIYVFNVLGYLLSTMLLTGFLAKLLGAKNEETILTAVSIAFLTYFLFKIILKVLLPVGVLGW